MSSTMVTLLGCFGTVFIVALALAYIGTSISRKKSECPECSKKNPVTKAFYVDESTGEKIEGEGDISFAFVSAIGGIVLGIGACVYVLAITIPAFGDASCDFEGIIIECVSYGGSTKVTTTINLPIAFVALFGGLGAIFNGINRIRRTLASRGKSMIYQYTCSACQHSWSEEAAAVE